MDERKAFIEKFTLRGWKGIYVGQEKCVLRQGVRQQSRQTSNQRQAAKETRSLSPVLLPVISHAHRDQHLSCVVLVVGTFWRSG